MIRKRIDSPRMMNANKNNSKMNGNPIDNNNNNNNAINKDVQEGKYKKQLSLKVKNILSPHAKIKSDRRSNYMYRHSSDKIDTNLLILFHGAGDSHLPFHTLAKKMELPQTATLCIHANSMGEGFVTLPFGLGYTWFEEMNYHTNGNKLQAHDEKRISSLTKAVEKIDHLIDDIIMQEETDNNWLPERIFLFGFSAGASLVMNLCHHRVQIGKLPLGGAICIAGGFHGITLNTSLSKNDNNIESDNKQMEHTPLLLVGGENDETYTVDMLNQDANLYKEKLNNLSSSSSVQTFIQPAKGHDMLKHEEESKCVMQFFGDKMVRRTIAMEGFSEVSPFLG